MFSESDSIDSISDDENKENIIIQQFVSDVIDFSSQYGNDSSISYSAINITKKPSKFPCYGDFAETYQMRTYGTWWSLDSPSSQPEFSLKDITDIPFQDFIVISFQEFVLPTSLSVFETYNPGALVRIYAYSNHNWIQLWQQTPAPVEKKSREYILSFKNISVPTKILRLEFNHSLLDYFTAIDAVLLTGIKCDVPNGFNKYGEPTQIKGLIQKKLETVHFKPLLVTQNEAIEEFLKYDLNTFIEKVGLSGNAIKSHCNSYVDENCDKKVKSIIDLPYEVIFNVMSFLDLKTIFRCSMVCRSFKQITLDPLLYVEINLKPYWHCTNTNLMNYLTRRARLVKKLDLSSCGLFNKITANDFMEFIKANGKTLTHLRLNSCKFLNNSCLELICLTCKNLKELTLRNYINIYETSSRDFQYIALLNKLEVLDFFRSGIDTIPLLNILKNNPHLKHLNLGFSPQNVNMDEIAVQISNYNKEIISIDMWKSHSLTALGICALSNCHQLQEIDFGWCLREESLPSESLKQLLQNCKNLKKIFLAAIRGLTERDLENIANYCSNLEQLDLMGIQGVSNEMVLKILQSCRRLKLFDLSFCDHLDDVQIMKWRHEFDVSIKRSEVPSD